MIDDLDRSIEKLLQSELGPVLPFDLSFAVPDKAFAPMSAARNTLSCYLYDLRENRELRSALPRVEHLPGGRFRRRQPAERVQASYCITAWSPAMVTAGINPPQDEHKLLADVLQVLLRYPELPDAVLVGSLNGQMPPPPTMVIQPDSTKIVNDFWTAIGGQLRPSLDYRVSVSLDYRGPLDGPIATSQISRVAPIDATGVPEERIQIGGRVLDASAPPLPVAGAWVRLDAGGVTAVSDADGRFVFQGVARGSHVLSARAVGHPDALRPVQVPEPSGHYDLTLV